MYRAIVIVIDNDNKNHEEIDLTAKKVLNRIQESMFDHPEINLHRLADYGLIASTILSDSEWLDPLP